MPKAISGYHSSEINIIPELLLIDAIVSQARREAESKDSKTRRRAIAWLKSMRLSVGGSPRKCCLQTTRRKARAL